MTESTCRRCGNPVTLVTREGRVQRGERRVAYPVRLFLCQHCADPETGETPYAYSDNELLRSNIEAAQAAWQQRYGESIPPRKPAGRPRAQPQKRDATIALRLTADELERLDGERGEQSRAAFIRAKLFGGLEPRTP